MIPCLKTVIHLILYIFLNCIVFKLKMTKISSSVWFVKRLEFVLSDHCFCVTFSAFLTNDCVDCVSALFIPLLLFLAIVLTYSKEKNDLSFLIVEWPYDILCTPKFCVLSWANWHIQSPYWVDISGLSVNQPASSLSPTEPPCSSGTPCSMPGECEDTWCECI